MIPHVITSGTLRYFHCHIIYKKRSLPSDIYDKIRCGSNVYSTAFLYCFMVFIHSLGVNTLKPRQNGRHFPDDIFKCIFLNGNEWISFKISLKFVPMGPFNNILALVQIMAWLWPGDEPLSEPMLFSLLTHICVIWPQWVNVHCHRFVERSWIKY